MLQFTRVWTLDHPLAGQLGDRIEGCLARKNHHGELVWNPPLNYMPGGKGRKQLHHLTVPFYNYILEALNKSKYLEKLDNIVDLNERKPAENPQLEDNTLPERIDIL